MPHGGDGERQVASDRSVTMAQGRYWIALFKKGGESAGVEHELARHDEFDLARSIYRQMVANYPARLVMLCDRATVLARSDRSPARIGALLWMTLPHMHCLCGDLHRSAWTARQPRLICGWVRRETGKR